MLPMLRCQEPIRKEMGRWVYAGPKLAGETTREEGRTPWRTGQAKIQRGSATPSEIRRDPRDLLLCKTSTDTQYFTLSPAFITGTGRRRRPRTDLDWLAPSRSYDYPRACTFSLGRRRPRSKRCCRANNIRPSEPLCPGGATVGRGTAGMPSRPRGARDRMVLYRALTGLLLHATRLPVVPLARAGVVRCPNSAVCLAEPDRS